MPQEEKIKEDERQVAIWQSAHRGTVELSKTYKFEASHVLPLHKGKCSRLHGHSWELTVTRDGFVNPETGFVVDYYDLGLLVNEHIINQVDHTHLGQGNVTIHSAGGFPARQFEPFGGPSFYPSSENLVHAFVRLLQPLVQELGQTWQQVRLKQVELNETCTSACVWRRP
jgi:6-pyruvoyl tetrahydropterin synthase/QueD family protein